MNRIFPLLAVLCLAAATTACSALTQPEEITISAEPLPSPNAPPAPMPQAAARPGAMPMPAGGQPKTGG